jgi:pimeloyl-ACP methyl ester carboxylesterase
VRLRCNRRPVPAVDDGPERDRESDRVVEPPRGRVRFGHPQSNAFVSLTATEQRHTLGTSHPERYNPDTWTDEYAHLSRPGQREIQADLLYDYRTNVASYPAWQAWLLEHKPPTLVVWGRNDPSFIAPGAEAFKRDLPGAEIHLLDAGHFAKMTKRDIAG